MPTLHEGPAASSASDLLVPPITVGSGRHRHRSASHSPHTMSHSLPNDEVTRDSRKDLSKLDVPNDAVPLQRSSSLGSRPSHSSSSPSSKPRKLRKARVPARDGGPSPDPLSPPDISASPDDRVPSVVRTPSQGSRREKLLQLTPRRETHDKAKKVCRHHLIHMARLSEQGSTGCV